MEDRQRQCRVVVVGAGFGGLAAARALRRAPVEVVLVDRANHHLFTPLLYQVATAYLGPGDIASPVRQLVRGQPNARVLLAEAEGVDLGERELLLRLPDGAARREPFDFLVVATGVRSSYFGHDEWEPFAPALKTLQDATALRDRVLAAFELAELEREDGSRRDELLTFVLVGAGPTGVEMAGALAELARETLAGDFRRIDPRRTRVVLLEAGARILPGFDERLARRAAARLTAMGVEVRCGRPVEAIDAHGVVVGGERLAAATVAWTAGVMPTPAAAWLGAPTDRAGRVRVAPDLTVPGRPELFAIGDVASLDQDGRALPGVAQVALQQGRHVARVIAARLAGSPPPPPFRYRDLGNMAVVGRNFALLERRGLRLGGYLAWLAWALVHLESLALFSNRLAVFTRWAWQYFTAQRGSRLILGKP